MSLILLDMLAKLNTFRTFVLCKENMSENGKKKASRNANILDLKFSQRSIEIALSLRRKAEIYSGVS
jgi:hypothetical protein